MRDFVPKIFPLPADPIEEREIRTPIEPIAPEFTVRYKTISVISSNRARALCALQDPGAGTRPTDATQECPKQCGEPMDSI